MKPLKQIFALIDINNCYVSCERLFQPHLNHRPVVVLSNNDGCVVSRSEEAKQLGIKMAVPFYQIQEQIKQHNIAVFSSNYALYAEMSRRFNNTIQQFVSAKDIEIYSIDETFIELSSYSQTDLNELAQEIKATLWKWLALPVCVGIGHSKTEAKLANHIAKKNSYFNGVCNLIDMDLCSKEALLQLIDVDEVWGVGRKLAKKLHALKIHSVFDLAISDPEHMERKFSILMKKTILELTGTPCIELEQTTASKQQIISSRSFGQRVTDIHALSEALSDYLQSAVQRLRAEKSLCSCMIIFAQSSRFDQRQAFYNQSVTIAFNEPTDSALIMNKAIMKHISTLFQEGIAFKKCGVILTGIEPKQGYIHDLLADTEQIEKQEHLQQVLDSVKNKFGTQKLAIGACKLQNRTWAMNRSKLSPNYFSLEGLLALGD
ncbi:Y-family DNA polymerase [Acinetobacter sp. A3]|uniref:Y-family DNA polymerase n=1 Tax=Acinetobacter sp. A3 TaxID=2725492 RepID=UPI00144643E6|nr:Y-family DNA polymerase [Acinetobacter sp. A3]